MCQYCQGGKLILDGKYWEMNVDNKYSEKELYIRLQLGGGYDHIDEDVSIDIKFCPMCGDKL